MTSKQTIGIILLGASVGALVYLYQGFLKPRLEVDALFKKNQKPKTQTTIK